MSLQKQHGLAPTDSPSSANLSAILPAKGWFDPSLSLRRGNLLATGWHLLLPPARQGRASLPPVEHGQLPEISSIRSTEPLPPRQPALAGGARASADSPPTPTTRRRGPRAAGPAARRPQQAHGANLQMWKAQMAR